MRRALPLAAITLAMLAVRTSGAQEGGAITPLPMPVPQRPFLLVEAPRFGPAQVAELSVRRAEPGTFQVALFQVRDPELLLGARAPHGLSLEGSPLGAELETLLVGEGALPRRAERTELLVVREASAIAPRRRGAVRGDETALYDSFDDDTLDVATSGVHARGWTHVDVPLGRLEPGMYLARALDGAYAASALFTVGETVLLVRRGDLADVTLVTDRAGHPLGGVVVEARQGARVVASATTQASGLARFAATSHAELRYVARRGADLSFADVAHATLPACDERIYLATGRPVFRSGERMHVRGHLRGCDASGRDVALGARQVALYRYWDPESPGEPLARLTTDAEGDFTAELPAHGSLTAVADTTVSTHYVSIDDRPPPRVSLRVQATRAWAAAGQSVGVTVSDGEGGWPRQARVVLQTPSGRQESVVGPNLPAAFTVTLPRTDEVLERAPLIAYLTEPGHLLTARAEIWTGRHAQMVELSSPATHGRSGQAFPVRARARDLGGAPSPGPATLSVYGSDGQRATGARRSAQVLELSSGWNALDLSLPGAGPWWVSLRRGESEAGLVVRERPSPPALSRRGELAIAPRVAIAEPGTDVELDVRAPRGGGLWVTLEQGGVQSSALLEARGGTQRVALAVPETARGLATVVLTHIDEGRVTRASCALEVRTSRTVSLSATLDRTSAPAGAHTRLVLEARDVAGRPVPSVASVWVADAGYWDLDQGPAQPSPTSFFRLPGRPASAGDGQGVAGWGSEAGRHLRTTLRWNGETVPRTTFRHAWGFGGALVRFRKQGSLAQVAAELARVAGLAGARTCDDEGTAALPTIDVEGIDIPWDLAAVRIVERLVALHQVTLDAPYLEGRVLVMPCAGAGGAGRLGARQRRVPRIRTGSADVRMAEEEEFHGDVFFAGRVVLGPDGRAELDIPLPARPGRWRVEALTIAASDGGGASADAIVHTTQAVTMQTSLPAHLRVGDETEVLLDVSAAGHASDEVALALHLEGGLSFVGEAPTQVRLDASGHAALTLRLRAERDGVAALRAHAQVGSDEGRSRVPVEIHGSTVTQPIALRAIVGPDASDVTLPLPPTTGGTVLRVAIGSDLGPSIRAALEDLRLPRWQVPLLQVDRVASIAALRRATHALRDERALPTPLISQLDGALQAYAIDVLGDPGAPLSAWWRRWEDDASVLAQVVSDLEPWADGARDLYAEIEPARQRLRELASGGQVDPRVAAMVACAIAGGRPRDHALALSVLRSADTSAPEQAIWALRAAARLGSADVRARARPVEALVDAATRAGSDTTPCRGPAWFVCLARGGDRALAARAADALMTAGVPGARDRAARLARALATRAREVAYWAWGTSEADELALIARLEGAGGALAHAEVWRDGQRIGVVDGDQVLTIPAGSGPLELRLRAAPGRFATIRVDGEVELSASDAGSGPVPLERRFVFEPDGSAALELRFALRRRADDVEVRVPLPAQLEVLALRGPGSMAVATRGGALRWASADPRARTPLPLLTREGDALVARWERLDAGELTLRVPLAASARGHFGAGAAALRTSAPDVWGLSPPTRVDAGPSATQ